LGGGMQQVNRGQTVPMKLQELSNGLRIVTQPMPWVNSVSLCILVRCGCVHESAAQAGASHFLEHMVFKGTPDWSAADIARAIDGVGGQLNAYTAKEYTCFYVTLLPDDLPLGLSILCDMLQNPRLDAEELRREQGVVLEEIAQAHDAPDDVVFEELNEGYFGPHPLGRPILGTAKSVAKFTPELLRGLMDQRYAAGDVVVSGAGHFDADAWDALAQQYLVPWRSGGTQAQTPTFVSQAPTLRRAAKKGVEQAHVCLGYPGLSLGHDDAWALLVLNNILGGGLSSRLFLDIREERGLAYSVYSYPSFFRSAGLMTLYAGCAPAQLGQVEETMRGHCRRLAEEELPEDEFARAHRQMMGSWLLGQDSASARAQGVGRALLLRGELLSDEQVLQKMKSITKEQVENLAKTLLTAEPHVALAGKLK